LVHNIWYCDRLIGSDLSGDIARVDIYDRMNGVGAFADIVEKMRARENKYRPCGYCYGNTPTNKLCSGCMEVYYCDATCQLGHWRIHQRDCVVKMHIEKGVGGGSRSVNIERVD